MFRQSPGYLIQNRALSRSADEGILKTPLFAPFYGDAASSDRDQAPLGRATDTEIQAR